jgi:hypothetical protein
MVLGTPWSSGMPVEATAAFVLGLLLVSRESWPRESPSRATITGLPKLFAFCMKTLNSAK